MTGQNLKNRASVKDVESNPLSNLRTLYALHHSLVTSQGTQLLQDSMKTSKKWRTRTLAENRNVALDNTSNSSPPIMFCGPGFRLHL